MARTAPRRQPTDNPANRFEKIIYDPGEEFAQPSAEDDPPPPPTQFYRDPSRRAVAWNDSPDLPFAASLNPYRGCMHACTYCYARPTHEYLGFSAGRDFETKILVKDDLPAVLRAELSAPHWKPQVVAIGGVTDPYQPIERKTRLTRRCLEVFLELRNPVTIVTKGTLVRRDLDLLVELARLDLTHVYVSVTTLDRELQRSLEPLAAAPSQRIAAIEALASAGIPVGVLVAPVIPGLTDHEAPAIVDAVARAGALNVRHVMLRLPHGVKQLFETWLERHHPDRRAKVMNRVRAMRGGRLNDPRFHLRQRGTGFFADQTHALFAVACRRAGLAQEMPPLSTAHFRHPGGEQLPLL